MSRPLPRRRSSRSLLSFWPVMVGLCLLMAGASTLWASHSSSVQVVQLASEKTEVEAQRDFVANRASDFAASALAACSDDSIKGKLPPTMCSQATRIVSEPVPKQIVGPPGERGLQGVQGVQGPPGPQGIVGKPGPGVESIDFERDGSVCVAVVKFSDGRATRPAVASQICGTSTSSSSESSSAEPTPG